MRQNVDPASNTPQTTPVDNSPSASVTDAIQTRRCIRDFTDRVVDEETIREMLDVAARAASGGNVQPWKVYVLGPEKRNELVAKVHHQMSNRNREIQQYDIYPKGMEKLDHPLNQPYMARRRQLAYQMYALQGVDRTDKVARALAMAKNFEFFGAPVALMLTLDKEMGAPQWADVGTFLGNLYLLAREKGFHTCPQEAWANWPESVSEICGIDLDKEIVFTGLAIGYANESAPVNTLRSPRAPMGEWATFVGGYDKARL